MTAYEFSENKGAGAFNKIPCTDVVEHDSGYQEVLCPMLKGGCSPDEFDRDLLTSGACMQKAVRRYMKDNSDKKKEDWARSMGKAMTEQIITKKKE